MMRALAGQAVSVPRPALRLLPPVFAKRNTIYIASFAYNQRRFPRNSAKVVCWLERHGTQSTVTASKHRLVCGSVPSGKHPGQITDQLYTYLLRHTREPQILQELREETAKLRGSQMQVSPDQAQFLAMLVQIMGAKRCIEVGVFHGYSSLAVALVLPEGGRLVACERDERSLAVARKYYDRAGVADKVDVRHGLAMDSLNELLQNGEADSYDFAFLDADKRMYLQYYELLLQLVRSNGVVVVDNVFWYGRTVDPLVDDKKTQALRDFNRFLLLDERISVSMVPIGDGMTLCRKR